MFSIRRVAPEECEIVISLIKELAAFVECGGYHHAVKVTPQQLRLDIFGEEQYCDCLVAEMHQTGEIVGYAVYRRNYSTWEGRAHYLEDLYVKPPFRKYGIGTALFKAVNDVALSKGSVRLEWAAMNWNKPALAFYERLGGLNLTESDGLILFRFNHEMMKQFAQS